MIHLDRSKVQEPAWFRSKEHAALQAKLAAHFAKPVESRKQVDSIFPIAQIRKAADESLLELSRGKCAYCESSVRLSRMGDSKQGSGVDSPVPYSIDMFRPKQLGGDSGARDHYWWLAIEWDNLLPSCRTCNSAKRNHFPIHASRCTAGVTGDFLAAEQPLLIDPTRELPEQFLCFEANGSVRPLRRDQLSIERASITIGHLHLNRTELVANRKLIVERARFVYGLSAKPPTTHELTNLRKLAYDVTPLHAAPHSAAARFELARWLLATGPRHLQPELLLQLSTLLAPYLEALRIESVAAPRRTLATARPAAPAPPPPALPDFTSDRITRITLDSFRSIRRIELAVPTERPRDLVSGWREQMQSIAEFSDLAERREWGWKMLLGENGAGKSSILQAVALALMGQAFYDRHRVDYGLERSLRQGARKGLLRVELEESAPVEVEITRKGLCWRTRPDGVPLFLRGYGATRLLPRRTTGAATAAAAASASRAQPVARMVDSLFDPHAPLIDAEGWLRGLEAHDFHAAATNLKSLLDLHEEEADFGFEERRQRRGRFGLWRAHGKRQFARFEPLEHFSAGYQTILALGCDIMAGSGRTISATRDLPGIVLLDEIGTNLHPRWRLAIVRKLGNCFPCMQFLASTHEPLCLRGLGEGEVAVVRRVEDEVVVQDRELPSPAHLRVEQLLTSPYFGLDSTSDPWLQRAHDICCELATREATLAPKERELLKRLRELLQAGTVLGSTRREQLLFSAIEQAMAAEKASAGPKRLAASPELRDAARRAIGQLGARPAARRGGRR